TARFTTLTYYPKPEIALHDFRTGQKQPDSTRRSQRLSFSAVSAVAVVQWAFDLDPRQAALIVQWLRAPSPQFLIEKLADDRSRHRYRLLRGKGAGGFPVAERGPQRHVGEIQVQRVGDVDTVVPRGGAPVDDVARAESSTTGRVRHQQRTPERRVDHRAVLRTAIEVQDRRAALFG